MIHPASNSGLSGAHANRSQKIREEGSAWYLVAVVEGEIRTYRVSRVVGATLTDDRCIRPKDFDLAAHWVADAGWGEPDDAGSAFDLLADRRVIDRETATSLRAAVGLRNRIAHGYALLDYARVHQEAQAGIPALRRFLLAITEVAGI